MDTTTIVPIKSVRIGAAVASYWTMLLRIFCAADETYSIFF